MPAAGLPPAIRASERPETYAFRRRGHWDRLNSVLCASQNHFRFPGMLVIKTTEPKHVEIFTYLHKKLRIL
jgi:hypothetical protein